MSIMNMCSQRAFFIASHGRHTALWLMVLFFVSLSSFQAHAQGWTLTNAERRAFLEYYAPIILKRANANNGDHGRDWITNFDFDRDANFANNRLNWRNIGHYIDASMSGPNAYYESWRIRPTLYTSLIEFMDGGKSLILLYHIYHGMDGGGIHDWERVELLIRNVVGPPGSGEYVDYATITLHHEHIVRRYYDSSMNFMQTTTGRHLLIWQAEWSNRSDASPDPAPDKQELRFVTNPYSWIATQHASPAARAEVNVLSEGGKKNVHYVFVPEGSVAAVSAWGASPLAYSSAASLTSRYDNEANARWGAVPRITYELQDLADILPTHWQYGGYQTHWTSANATDVLLESPIINESGQAEISAGMQRFFTESRDTASSSGRDDRDGYPAKSWFFGTYSMERNPDLGHQADDFKTPSYAGSSLDYRGHTRGSASGYLGSHSTYWWQHDYFVHFGDVDDSGSREAGFWLPGAWYLAANGGFDGRWVQLFDDRHQYEPTPPLRLSVRHPSSMCTETFIVTATATGGQSPYHFTWTGASPFSSPSDPTNTAVVYAYTPATVTVGSADGQTRSSNLYYWPYCSDGEQIP